MKVEVFKNKGKRTQLFTEFGIITNKNHLKDLKKIIENQIQLIETGKIKEFKEKNELINKEELIMINPKCSKNDIDRSFLYDEESKRNDMEIRESTSQIIFKKRLYNGQEWIKTFIKDITKEKVEDTSQYEIENGLQPQYPITLLTGEIVNDKREYQNSEYWNILKTMYSEKLAKKEGIKRVYYICEQCGELSMDKTHLHHRTYENFGKEKATDMIRVCYKCHCKIHNRKILDRKEYDKNKRENLKIAKEGLGIDCELKFGKYKGLKVEEVLKIDKSYLKWLFENADTRFSEEVLSLLIE